MYVFHCIEPWSLGASVDVDFGALKAASGALWPYLVVIFAGFMPSEIWRWSGVFISRGFSEQDQIIVWVRSVSATLLTAVVAKLILNPSGALLAVPLVLRVGSLAVGMTASMLYRRSVLVAIIVAELILVAGYWLLKI